MAKQPTRQGRPPSEVRPLPYNDGQMSADKSLKARMMTGYALCAIAESQIHAGELERALKSIRAIREMVAEMNSLLDEPREYSLSAIREAKDTLADLETRLQAAEAAIPG